VFAVDLSVVFLCWRFFSGFLLIELAPVNFGFVQIHFCFSFWAPKLRPFLLVPLLSARSTLSPRAVPAHRSPASVPARPRFHRPRIFLPAGVREPFPLTAGARPRPGSPFPVPIMSQRQRFEPVPGLPIFSAVFLSFLRSPFCRRPVHSVPLLLA
jgi:hypothetical protein